MLHSSTNHIIHNLLFSLYPTLLRHQFVDQAPFAAFVTATTSSGYTSTAEGPGLGTVAIGYPTSFLVTLRDPYGNLVDATSPSITMRVNGETPSGFSLRNLNNGSYLLRYTPTQTGDIVIHVKIDGRFISGSPFTARGVDTTAVPLNTYAVGPGLLTGVAGQTSYFELFALGEDGSRVGNNDEGFRFAVRSAYDPFNSTVFGE